MQLSELFHITAATCRPAAVAGVLQSGKQNCCQNCDDGDDHKQFNKSKAVRFTPARAGVKRYALLPPWRGVSEIFFIYDLFLSIQMIISNTDCKNRFFPD